MTLWYVGTHTYGEYGLGKDHLHADEKIWYGIHFPPDDKGEFNYSVLCFHSFLPMWAPLSQLAAWTNNFAELHTAEEAKARENDLNEKWRVSRK